MRAAWLVMGLLACERAPEPAGPLAPKPTPTTPVTAPAVVAEAPAPTPAVAPAPPPPATPPAVEPPAAAPRPAGDEPPPPPTHRTLAVPPALAAAPAWVGRRFMTGLIMTRSSHETFTLQRLDGQALVTVETRRSRNGMSGDIGAWQLVSRVQYLGTASEKANVVTIDVANGADRLQLTCKRTRIAVAGAKALRGRSPGYDECGDEGRWVPRATTRLEVIRCNPFEEPKPDDLDAIAPWDKLAFAAAPGVEWLHVNDDCVIQGGGWRKVPVDGSIAGIRVGEP